MQNNELLTRRELAEALGISYQRIRKLEDAGVPKYILGEKLARFNLSEVLEWLKHGRMKQAQEPLT